MRGCFLFFFSRQKSSSSATHDTKKNNNLCPLTQLQSAEKPQGRTWKKSAWPSYQLLPKNWYLFQYLTRIWLYWSTTGECMNSTSSILRSYTNALRCTQKQITLLWIKIGVLHLGEELGLWGMLGPPCGVRMPWQLSVTSRQMIAVLPDPALPTMTAPRPSQLLVFLRTSSRRVKSQSRPTKAVSAVIPGTSNSSGFSMMSACLNGTNLPGKS